MEKPQRTTIKVFLREHTTIGGNFIGTPNEIQEFINNVDNQDATLTGDSIYGSGEIINIPIEVLKKNAHTIAPEYNSKLYYESLMTGYESWQK
ncbi:hypothetical protein [Dysgonomonas sp.]